MRDHLAEVIAARDEAALLAGAEERRRDEAEVRIDRFIEDWNKRGKSLNDAAMRFGAWTKKAGLLEIELRAWCKTLADGDRPFGKLTFIAWHVEPNDPRPPIVKGNVEIEFRDAPGAEADIGTRHLVARRTGLISTQPPGQRRMKWDFSYEALVPPGIAASSSRPVAILVHREWAEEWEDGS